MTLRLAIPEAGLTPMTKAFVAGMLIGVVYGVLFALFQGS
jgi:hypothetical protein